MRITFKNLKTVDKTVIIELMNQPLVQRHMPLASTKFGEEEYTKFIEAKENLWKEHGYGPWALEVEGSFVGWGGLQPEGKDVEIALVLHPKYWGYGKAIYDKIITYAFVTLHLDSLIVLFPSSRKKIKGLHRLGFTDDGITEVDGIVFHRYRLRSVDYYEKIGVEGNL